MRRVPANRIHRREATWILLAAAIATSGCAHAATAEVTGTVVYRQRVALPPDAVVHVRLEDASRADAPATVIAQADVDRDGRQVPIPFRLPYDPARIDASHRYVLRATIRAGERLLFTSTTAHDVVTRGAPSHVEVVVTPAAAPAPQSAPETCAPDAGPTLEETYWKIVEVDGAPVEVEPGDREPHLRLHTAGKRLAGFTGCNDFFGTYEHGPDVLRLVPSGTTMKACDDRLTRQERAILGALAATTERRSSCTELELRGGGKALLRLQARD
jgi:putative lipoprotein